MSPNPKQQCISIGSALQLKAESPYTLQWAALSPPNCPFPWESGSRLIHDSLDPPESSTQTASQSAQPFYRVHDCNRQTDRQTDHATQSVNSRQHLRT